MSGAAKVKGYSTRRPAADVVTIGPDNEAKVMSRPDWRGYTAEPVQPSAPIAPSTGQQLLKALDEDCRRAFAILRRLPMPGDYVALKTSDRASGGLAAKWIGTIVNKATDYQPFRMERGPDGSLRKVFEAPRVSTMVSSVDVTFMDAMFDVMMTLGFGSLDWRLVTGRAQRVKWEQLRLIDVNQRSTKWLRKLHGDALHKLLPVWLARLHKI